MSNKTNSTVGRPSAKLVYPRGAFTVQDLYDLNRGPKGRGKRPQICMLTIRNHIKAKLADKSLALSGKVTTGTVGKPAHKYIRVKAVVTTPTETTVAPVVNETPVALTETTTPEVVTTPTETTVPLSVETVATVAA